jgi:hypothetical protein
LAWVELPHPLEQLAAGRPREPLRGEHQGDLLSGVREAREARERLVRRVRTDDAIVALVAVAHRTLDVAKGGGIGVDG